MDKHTMALIMQALILSRLDYCSSLLLGCANYQFDWLHKTWHAELWTIPPNTTQYQETWDHSIGSRSESVSCTKEHVSFSSVTLTKQLNISAAWSSNPTVDNSDLPSTTNYHSVMHKLPNAKIVLLNMRSSKAGSSVIHLVTELLQEAYCEACLYALLFDLAKVKCSTCNHTQPFICLSVCICHVLQATFLHTSNLVGIHGYVP